MPDQDIKIPYALRNGQIVHVGQVPRGLDCNCTCPCCSQRLIAYQGQVQTHHFGHQAGATACETPLHSTAKWMLFDRIDRAISKKEPVPIRWQCRGCPCIHNGNLLETADLVFPPEESLPDSNIRPDLWLSDDYGMSPCAFIEVVVTHEPARGTRDYARDGSVAIWEFHLSEAEDLEKLKMVPLLPDAAMAPFCLCELCPGCNRRPCFMDMRDHRWCDVCQECYRTIPGGEHQHCEGCGDLLNPYAASAGYTFCNDCYDNERNLLDPSVFPSTGAIEVVEETPWYPSK